MPTVPRRIRSSGCGAIAAFLRALALALFTAVLAPAWVTSVEFPFTTLPRAVWEGDLAHLKEMGVTHVSLPQPASAAQLDDVISIVRRLNLEADIEGPIPGRLELLTKSHGGPLTEVPAGAVRVSALMPRALENERQLLTAGTRAIVWTDAFETLNPAYQPGAIALAGAEGPGTALIRREAQIARFWGSALSALPETPGAARLTVPVEGVSVHQYIADKGAASLSELAPPGLSMASVVNNSSDAWKGEVRVMYPAVQRLILLPAVAVAAHDVLWLPVDIPLTVSSLCSGCNGFAPSDHLAYATAELTDMEYENGILAMEFMAHSPGEAILQLSHEPVGPLIAAGKPSTFDWDPKTQRVRLPIPAGNSVTGRVRVALAVDAPSATAFFDSAPVLLIGATSRLTAQFSPYAVAARSRLRIVPDLTAVQENIPPESKEAPARVNYKIDVPASAIAGDTALLAIEADGMQLSHTQLRMLPPVAITFQDAVAVRVAENSSVPIAPATIPVNQRSGRDIVMSLRNNAPEIRTFEVTIAVPDLEFSPEKLTVTVGASVARELTFRVFGSAPMGAHEGVVRLSGAAALAEPVRFIVLPPTGAIAWSAEGFSILETVKLRASFMAGRWLEMINKESGADSQPAGGTVFSGGLGESLRMEDLEKLAAPKPAH